MIRRENYYANIPAFTHVHTGVNLLYVHIYTNVVIYKYYAHQIMRRCFAFGSRIQRVLSGVVKVLEALIESNLCRNPRKPRKSNFVYIPRASLPPCPATAAAAVVGRRGGGRSVAGPRSRCLGWNAEGMIWYSVLILQRYEKYIRGGYTRVYRRKTETPHAPFSIKTP